MARTLLIGNPQTTWREWLKANGRTQDYLSLDPADSTFETPTVFRKFERDRPVFSRFYGSLDPGRAPHLIVAALAESLPLLGDNSIVQLFAYRATPLLRQTISLVATIFRPDRILIPEGTIIDRNGFPVGPEDVALEAAFPAIVQQAQRKAHWLKLLEQCERQTVPLRDLSWEGTRLGTGEVLDPIAIGKLPFEAALRVERTVTGLTVVTAEEPSEEQLSRAMDLTGAGRVHLIHPDAYNDVLAAFARQDGEEFGLGMIERVDWEEGLVIARNTAVAPAPVRILRVGSLRVDAMGKELGELKPWAI